MSNFMQFLPQAAGALGYLQQGRQAAFSQGADFLRQLLSSGWWGGRGSWFGQYGYGRHQDGQARNSWVDRGDNGRNASGLPQTVPGIALPTRATLGHYFCLYAPNGNNIIVQHVDLGPARYTGKGIDINAAAADKLGYAPGNFPTGHQWKWRHLGATLPPGLVLGKPVQYALAQAAQPAAGAYASPANFEQNYPRHTPRPASGAYQPLRGYSEQVPQAYGRQAYAQAYPQMGQGQMRLTPVAPEMAQMLERIWRQQQQSPSGGGVPSGGGGMQRYLSGAAPGPAPSHGARRHFSPNA